MRPQDGRDREAVLTKEAFTMNSVARESFHT
jgi:hypothetical protein